MEFGVKIPKGFDVQSARGAPRELLGGNGKLRRSGGAIITTIVVKDMRLNLSSGICASGRNTLPNRQI